MIRPSIRLARLLAPAALLLSPLAAQTPLQTFNGGAAANALGACVASAGGTTNDGYNDILVGARDYDATVGFTTYSAAGLARVYSGTTGTLIQSYTGAQTDENLGWAVAGVGDVNADGFDDIVVGALGAVSGGIGGGTAQVYSGKTKGLLF